MIILPWLSIYSATKCRYLALLFWSACIGPTPSSAPNWIAARISPGLPLNAIGTNALCASIRQKMLAIPTLASGEMPAMSRAEIDVIDRLIRDALTELADNMTKEGATDD